jgi:DNA-directed RNA polymerase subunit beta
MLKKCYTSIDEIVSTDELVDMVDIEVNTPDNTFILANGILSHNSNTGVINQLAIGAKVTGSRGSFLEQADTDELSGILGVNSAMVPFIGSTDGCRVMFSGSQGRQSIPINGAEPPIIQTGYESLMTNMLSDTYIKKAIDDGYILKITQNSIAIKLKNGKIQRIGISPTKLQSGQGQSSINYFTPIVREGDAVKKGQIIAEGKHIIDGMISQGTNLLCAIMMWKGYSYEDGYIISDAVANSKFKSSAYHEVEVLISKTDNVVFVAREGAETKRGEPLLIRTSKEVESIVGLDEDELIQGQIITKSPGGKIISLEIYPNSNLKSYPILHEPFERFKAKYEEVKGEFPTKFVAKVFNEKEQFPGILVRFGIEDMQSAELGDKLTNSYGGKGTIAKIEKEENMPLTPWGERVQIILNPLAIINRMNPSTIKELQLSLISKFLAKKLVALGTKKNQKSIDLITEVLTVLDRTENKKLSKQMISAIKGMSDKAYAQYIQKIENTNYYFPIIVPPFQEPSNTDVVKAMKLVGAKASYILKLPEYGTNSQYPIAVGYLYYKKLEQQSGIKMSARSTGLIDPRTKQATAGKKAGGGQKIGELDSWSIINHGAINVLREFFGPLSDDHITKNQIVSDIIQTGTAEYRTPRSSPTREVFYVYLKSMMLEPDIK